MVPTDFIGIGDVRYDSLWRRLSLSREGVARIPGLVWTDVAAAMLVGTRSASNSLPAGGVEVQRLERKILYDVRFAIPAIIVLIFWTCALAVSIYRIVVSGVSLTKIKNVINQVSTGRALSSTTSLNETELVSSTSTWVGTVGQIRFRLPLNGEEKNDGGNSVIA